MSSCFSSAQPGVLHPVAAIGFFLLVCFAAGCGRHGKAAPTAGAESTPSTVNLKRNVDLARAEERALVSQVETVGYLEAEGQTEIAAGVKGIVDEVFFREGDFVTADTVLIKVDQRRYGSAAKLAEANLLRTEANLELAKDLEHRAHFAGQGASVEEKAKALLNLGVAKAEVESSRAALDMARNDLDRSRVRAPYSGWINQRKVTRGSYLEDKTIIATMADLTRLRLVGWIPESAAPLIREQMKQQERRLRAVRLALSLAGLGNRTPLWGSIASLGLGQAGDLPSGFDPDFTLLAFPQRTFRARIFFLSTVASPDTHMFECKAEIDTRGLDVELRPGYTARIRLPFHGNSHACVVPEEAVRASERGFIAFTPVQQTGRDGKPEWIARQCTLELGFRSPGWVEVRQGLQPGQWIIRRGAEALEDGTPIRFTEPPGFLATSSIQG